MSGFLASIRYNLAHLARFPGRETRGEFWPYVAFLFILQTIVVFAILVPIVVDMMVRVQRFVIEHPQGLPPANAGPGPYGPGMPVLPPELMPDFAGMMMPMAALNLAFVLLVGAAVVRRLHDRDMSGLWALLPLPFMILGQILAPKIFAAFTAPGPPDSQTFLLIQLNALLFWAALIILIVLLAQPGTEGPNRYGPESQLAP